MCPSDYCFFRVSDILKNFLLEALANYEILNANAGDLMRETKNIRDTVNDRRLSNSTIHFNNNNNTVTNKILRHYNLSCDSTRYTSLRIKTSTKTNTTRARIMKLLKEVGVSISSNRRRKQTNSNDCEDSRSDVNNKGFLTQIVRESGCLSKFFEHDRLNATLFIRSCFDITITF